MEVQGLAVLEQLQLPECPFKASAHAQLMCVSLAGLHKWQLCDVERCACRGENHGGAGGLCQPGL